MSKNSKNEVIKKDLSSHEDSLSEIPVRETNGLQVGGIIFDPALGARRVTQADIDKIAEQKNIAEEERKQRERNEEEYHKIKQEISRKKFEDSSPAFPIRGYHDGDTSRGYKPSRMLDIESDVAIMNTETMVTSIKESVEFIESKLWEIEDYLYRHDKKKRESLKLKKMKRKASLKGRSQGGTKKR